MPVLLLVLMVALCLPLNGQAANANPEAPGTKRFAVTLLSSFEPIPKKLLPTDVPRKVYRTEAKVFGRTIYFARVGFYATAGEAEAARKKLVSRYPAAFVTEITGAEYREATGGSTVPAAPRMPAAAPVIVAPKPAAPDELFVVTLARDAKRIPQPVVPLPDTLRGLRHYSYDLPGDGGATHSLNVGFFATPTEADRARRQLIKTYPQAKVRRISIAERNASARNILVAPGDTPSTVAAPTPALPTPTLPGSAAGPATVESEAITLIDRARESLTRGDNVGAIQALSKILQLPPNRQSQEAQELIGLAEERTGNTARAKQEYELYLKLYTEGPGPDRVRQRLAALAAPAEKPGLKAASRRPSDITTFYGGLSQNYYFGNSRVDTTLQTGPTVTPQPTLTLTDQSALISSVDINARMRRGDWDNRVVIRDTHTWNFLEGAENQNRLYSAYGETRYKPLDMNARLGRQPGVSGGVLGRFDGATLGYGFVPKFRLNLVAGRPVEYNPINSDKQFWGANLDYGTFAEHWSGNLYYVTQTIDDIIDRQAVGTELRYFDPTLNAFTLIDYDTYFGELNIGLFQLTKLFGTKTSVNVLVDHRKTPILTVANALIGETDTSIRSQLQTLTEEQLRTQAAERTAESNLYLVGVNHNFTTKWQLGGDIKLFNTTGTPASGPLPASPGTGNILAYTIQGIATTIFSKRDISVLAISYLDAPTYSGTSVSLSNRSLIQNRWTFDIALRYYGQQDELGSTLTRWSPSLRLGYRWRDSFTIEAEYGLEKTTTEAVVTGGTSTDEAKRNYMSLGYRWDF